MLIKQRKTSLLTCTLPDKGIVFKDGISWDTVVPFTTQVEQAFRTKITILPVVLAQ